MPQSSQTCQEKVSKKETFLFNHLNQEFWKFRKFFRKKSDSYILTLIGLLYYRGKNKVCYPSVPTLANLIGVCDRTVQRSIDEIEADGLVAVYNPYKEGKCYRPNSYLLSQVFNLTRVQKKIFSTLKSSLSEYVTLLKDSLLSLYRNMIQILVSNIRYSYLEKRKILRVKNVRTNLSDRNKHPT